MYKNKTSEPLPPENKKYIKHSSVKKKEKKRVTIIWHAWVAAGIFIL